MATEFKLSYTGSEINNKLGKIDGLVEAEQRLASEIATERARINSLSALGEGSTTGDAELQDIRVGANGIQYASAGEAVRKQFDNINEIVNEHEHQISGKKISSFIGAVTAGKAYNSARDEKLFVNVPANAAFDIIVETDSFEQAYIYYYKNDGTEVQLTNNLPTNTSKSYKKADDIAGFAVYVTRTNALKTGNFTLKIATTDEKSMLSRLDSVELKAESLNALQDLSGESLFFIKDSIIPSSSGYKGNLEGGGKKLLVNIPASTKFNICVETSVFDTFSLYYLVEGASSYIKHSDLNANTSIEMSIAYNVVGFAINVTSDKILGSGYFTLKVCMPNVNGISHKVDAIAAKHMWDIDKDVILTLTDDVRLNKEYKGYLSNYTPSYLPSGTEIKFCVETEAFTGYNFYYILDDENHTAQKYSYIIVSVGTEVSTPIPSNRAVIGFAIGVPTENILADGTFTLTVKAKNANGALSKLTNVEFGVIENDILKLNPQNEMLPLFQNAKVSIESGINYGDRRKKCLMLAHFSDIHGDSTNLGRIIRFTNEYRDYIDDVICSGDMVRDCARADDVDYDFSWWAENDASKVLMAIGNHDTNVNDSGSASVWRGFTKEETYAKYFAPFIESWGVTQPTDAETNGKCYYYKDYTDYGIRFITLDCMYYDTAQNTWFANTLTDAKNNGYSVIVMAHSIGKNGTNIECTYSAPNVIPGATITDTTDDTSKYCENVHDRIDEFISEGGTFICFLGGHFHRNMFGTVNNTTHTQAYLLAVSSGAYAPNRVHQCVVRTRSQDSFNIVSIDPQLKLIKVFTVGYQYDNYMRRIGTLCYNYETHTMVYNG